MVEQTAEQHTVTDEQKEQYRLDQLRYNRQWAVEKAMVWTSGTNTTSERMLQIAEMMNTFINKDAK
jgi:hypothetical protein